MTENPVPIYAHTDPAFPDRPERWEPLFSREEDCPALKGPGHFCERCELLERFHGHLNKAAWWAGKYAGEIFAEGSGEARAAREWGYLAGLWQVLGNPLSGIHSTRLDAFPGTQNPLQ